MNRKRKANQIRKNIMRVATIKSEKFLNRLNDGMKIYPKKEWGYCIEVEANGYCISAPDNDRYSAFKGAWKAVKWANEQEPARKRFLNELSRNDFYEEED